MTRVLIVGIYLLIWPALAWGHASIISTSPTSGAVLQRAPEMVVLTFNEPVAVTVIRLFDSQGHQLPTESIQGRHEKLHIPVPSADKQGTYLLSWRIVSADGHPVGGTLDFSIGAPSNTTGAPLSTASTARDIFIWLFRWLGYLSLFAAVGAAFFRAQNPATNVSWAWWAIGLGGLTLPVNLGLQGLDLLAAPESAIANLETWQEAVGSGYFWTLIFMASAWLAAAAVLKSQRRRTIGLAALISALLTGIAVASSGHASTAPPQWLARPMIALHVIMAIAWAGSLPALFRLLRPGRALTPDSNLAALGSFSRRITLVVTLVVVSGSILVLLQLDHVNDLWRTNYGIVLLGKLFLVTVLLLVAAGNRWRLTGPALSGCPATQMHLKYAIGAEIIVVVIILALVSVWRLTPPPRSLDAAQQQPDMHVLDLSNKQVHARLEKQSGSHIWKIFLTTPQGQVFTAESVTLTRSNPDVGIEPIRRKAHGGSDGYWQVKLPAQPSTGHWHTRLDILIDDFDKTTLRSD